MRFHDRFLRAQERWKRENTTGAMCYRPWSREDDRIGAIEEGEEASSRECETKGCSRSNSLIIAPAPKEPPVTRAPKVLQSGDPGSTEAMKRLKLRNLCKANPPKVETSVPDAEDMWDFDAGENSNLPEFLWESHQPDSRLLRLPAMLRSGLVPNPFDKAAVALGSGPKREPGRGGRPRRHLAPSVGRVPARGPTSPFDRIAQSLPCPSLSTLPQPPPDGCSRLFCRSTPL